jgi:hypothetical protein
VHGAGIRLLPCERPRRRRARDQSGKVGRLALDVDDGDDRQPPVPDRQCRWNTDPNLLPVSGLVDPKPD